MNLTHLSVRRLGTHRHRVPTPPTNDERLAAYRAYQPIQFANTPLAERIREADARRYAREQSLDGINFAEGFAFRYGSTHGAD